MTGNSTGQCSRTAAVAFGKNRSPSSDGAIALSPSRAHRPSLLSRNRYQMEVEPTLEILSRIVPV